MDTPKTPELNPQPGKPMPHDAKIKGELTYDDKVIQKIIGIALERIDGLLTVDGGFFSNIAEKLVNTDNVTSGIDVEVGKKQVAVDLSIVAEYGKDVAKLFTDIQELIVREVKRMTGLEVIEVNVKVVDIKSKEQHEKDSVTVQDRVSNFAESTGEFASDQTQKAKNAIGKGTEKAKTTINQGTEKAKEQMEPRVE